MVAYALSQMTMGCVSRVEEEKKELVKDVHRFSCLGVRLEDSPNGYFMVHLNYDSSLVIEEKSKKYVYPLFINFNESILGKINESFSRGGCVLRYQGRLYAPDVEDFRNRILEDDCGSHYSIYLGATKMYDNHREVYSWECLKRDIADII